MHTLSTALLILAASAGASAQTPAPPRAASNPSTLSVQVTDKSGNGIANVAIALSGPVDRSGMSGPDGSLAFRSMRAGTYRLRFEHEGFLTLEREVVLTRGAGEVSVALNRRRSSRVVTPPPHRPRWSRPVERTPRPVEPRALGLVDFIDQNFIGSEPQKILAARVVATAAPHA